MSRTSSSAAIALPYRLNNETLEFASNVRTRRTYVRPCHGTRFFEILEEAIEFDFKKIVRLLDTRLFVFAGQHLGKTSIRAIRFIFVDVQRRDTHVCHFLRCRATAEMCAILNSRSKG